MIKKIFLSLFLFTSSLLASNLGLYYVNADVLKIRLGPSSSYEHSYSMYHKQKTNVYEFKNSWARVSKSKSNSKWAYAKFLSPVKVDKKTETSKKSTPKKTKKTTKKKVTKAKKNKVDTRLLKYIAKSDNYEKHSKVFINVSQRLIANRVCKISDFRKTSGWMELSKDEMYFTYCGGFTKKDKIYINLVTNEIIGNMRKYK